MGGVANMYQDCFSLSHMDFCFSGELITSIGARCLNSDSDGH